jgi:amino acid adenylation domain-containing protein
MSDNLHLPLTSNQMGLWIIWQQDRSNPAYNLRLTYHINGEIDRDTVDKSLNLLFRNNPVLFARFPENNGAPFVEIVPKEVSVNYKDFSEFEPDLRKEKILSYLGADSRLCFDLEQGPLYRLHLVKENSTSYFFHLTIHHIIFDGGSIRIFADEFSRIYNEVLGGREELFGIKVANIKQYDEKSLSENEEGELVEYWKENLKGCSSFLRFPYDYPSKEHPSGFGYREHFQVGESITKRLREISNDAGSSLYRTMVAAIGVLMNKYTGDCDFCFGVPVSKRHKNPLLEKSIGYYVSTAVVRIQIDKKSDFKTLVQNVNDRVVNSIRKSKLPFDKIVEVIKPERIPNVNPLYQIVISSLNDMVVPMDLDGVVTERIFVPEDVDPFDFSFYIWENGSVIEGEIKYNCDILKNSTVVRMKENFIHLLKILTDNPDEYISGISIISENEHKLLESFNNTNIPFPGCLIHELFEKQAECLPDKTALISETGTLTYKGLNEKANQFAWYLKSLEIKPGDVVAICLDRSHEMVVAILGILKAGCTYLPMDVSYPCDRIQYMSDDANVKIIISQSNLGYKFDGLKENTIVYLDKVWEDIITFCRDNCNTDIITDSLAYIIYTSGSTGKPKGVKVHHKAVVNMISSMSKTPGMNENDVVLAVVTPAFDMSVYEIFTSLSNGSTLVIAGGNDITDGVALSGLIDKFGVTLLQATPSLWNILLASEWKGKKDIKALCGGEALTANLVRRILPKVSEFWNCYGPTETTVYATCGRITDAESPIVIGKALDNTKIYILDTNNLQLPCGVVGEVAIGGECITKGYNNLPEMTKEKFLQFSEGEVIYKTGDLGKYLEDGRVELYGRIDNQIKLRGFRIEPGEIETLLDKLSGVRESVVKIQSFDNNDERLVAFINAGSDFVLSDAEIKKSLANYLPQYMIPSFYNKSDGFPKMPNGKINKAALKMDVVIAKKPCRKTERPLTSTERKIFDIWTKVLKTNEFSIKDNFFDVGGNSLLAISVSSKINSRFKIDMKLRIFFDNPRIEALAIAVDISLLKHKKGGIINLKNDPDSNIVTGEI